MGAPLDVFASCAPGLEPLLADELRGLGLRKVAHEGGGAGFVADAATIERVLLRVGLAQHVLVRIGRFSARALGELERKAAGLAWEAWLRPGAPREVVVHAQRSRLFHAEAIAARVEAAITRVIGPAPPSSPPPELTEESGLPRALPPAAVHVRVHRDICTVSLDAAGSPLHRRGYKRAPGLAPLREDLARALLACAGWPAAGRLVDPMAGTGAIALEAAAAWANLAPGRLRRFAWEATARCDAGRMHGARQQVARDERPAPARPPVLALDADERAIAGLRANAARAGLEGYVHVQACALADADELIEAWRDGEPLTLVTDPPHGHRLGTVRTLPPLYAALGRLARGRAARAAWITAADELAAATGLGARAAFRTRHGGRAVAAWTTVAAAQDAGRDATTPASDEGPA